MTQERFQDTGIGTMKRKDFLIVQDLKSVAIELKEQAIVNYLDSLGDIEKQGLRGVLSGSLERANNCFLKRGLEVYLNNLAT